uniref:hypothetical protein n=1 Tax=Castellaniella defragrans TaxID=75697 RepID=UPI00333E8DAC
MKTDKRQVYSPFPGMAGSKNIVRWVAMTPKDLTYAVSLRAFNVDHVLLWQDGGNMPDKYCIQPGTSRFLSARTPKGLLRKATKLGFEVAGQEPVAMDLDKVFRVLAALRPGKSVSEKSCYVLLDGWNTLEDMARSLDIPLEGNAGDGKLLHTVYEKIFHGNNLPSITPVNEKYNPLFSQDERRVMRSHFWRIWREIQRRTGQFTSGPRLAGRPC